MKKVITVSLLACFITIGTMDSAQAQLSQDWNLKSRQAAQDNTSAAISLLNDGQLAKAIENLRRATSEDISDPQPFQILGLALGMKGQYAEALDSLQKSYTLKPASETLLSTGIIYYLQHDYDAAINAWNKMLQVNPSLSNVYGDIGMAMVHKGHLAEATDAFERLVHVYPNSDLGYYGLSLTNYLAGDFTAAQEQGERALSINNYPPILLLLANVDMAQGKTSRGRRRAEQYTAATHHPWLQRSMTELGFQSQQDFHWDPFVADTFDNGYLLLARYQKDWQHRPSLRQLGDSRTAVEGAAKQLSRAPGDLLLTHELAIVEMADGDYSSSAEHLQSVVQQCPACNTALLELGRTLALDGKSDRASEQIRAFRSNLPNQEISTAFTEPAQVDPALQRDAAARKRLPKLERVGPKPVPSSEF